MKPELSWLDTEFGPIAAAWFSPATTATRAVVIVPSVGHETPLMTHSLVAVGRRLADTGVLSVVVHPFGVDQSTGSLDGPEMLSRWRASVRRGPVGLGRSRLCVHTHAAVGGARTDGAQSRTRPRRRRVSLRVAARRWRAAASALPPPRREWSAG